MLVILKERGDEDKKAGILKISDDQKTVEIVKHPVFDEGEDYPYSMLTHLIHSVLKYGKEAK